MEEYDDFTLSGKAAVTEANLRDEYYWKLVADFIGAQSGEGLELETAPCKNRVLIQIGLLREDNNFPWIAILDWLKKIFPRHQSADFRRLIERGIATTLSLGICARLTFLESDVNFSFVGPVCDSIGVEREHLLEMRDFSERAQMFEVTNGLILELNNFAAREKISPVAIVPWLRNFDPDFCKKGNIQSAYSVIKDRIKKLKQLCRSYETRSHRRSAAMENFLQTPFELEQKKAPKIVKKRMRKDHSFIFEKAVIKEEIEDFEIMQDEGSAVNEGDAEELEDVSESGESEEDSDDAAESREETANEEALSLLDITMQSIEKLFRRYGKKSQLSKKASLNLLKRKYALTCMEHPAVAEFNKTLNLMSGDIPLASPVVFLNFNASFLVDLYDAVEEQIMSFEKEIILSTGDKLGRDKLPNFKHFLNMQESATSRYIHMASDILCPRSRDTQNYRKHWVAFCEEKKNPSRFGMNQSNRCISYFETAAGLIHHHKEIALFISDLLSLDEEQCPNVILESIAADANDSVIQSLVCVLAVLYCKIIGPYWQLLKSGGEYSLYSKYMLYLYQKFLDWSKDPATLLEPEETTNVFLQFPLHEKTFSGVFHYCGQWHTNRDMIRAFLKRTVKAIAGVTDEHLRAFLPGGTFGQVPSPEVSSQLVSCTFSVLMAEYPSSQESSPKRKKPRKSSKHFKTLSSGSSQEDNRSDSSDHEDDETSWQVRKKGQRIVLEKTEKAPKEEDEINMDREYIMETVTRNGGPCKTQRDVDQMMLRFDGKSRAEKRDGVRCEILYQRIILNNPDHHLDCLYENTSVMAVKLKKVLPRVQPGYTLVLAPKRTKAKPVRKDTKMDQSESSNLNASEMA
ncbi:uncharacterized protein LOC121523301 [Cheilinus undulatus]|uniref:uncharacterized protein LOC121523301 n=1 Tax=Cheilinus undulatus TaxID=241271 RepID=UPI001BD62DF7|nr:uncharacterized protein LOC121523301 [Cheilinus undulatus]